MPPARRRGAAPVRSPRLSLSIQGADRFDDLPAASTLRRWVRHALTADGRLTLRFVNTREGRRLNRDFRGRDYATNVLTFDYAQQPVEADIVLCVPVLRREAIAQQKSLRSHLAHLVVHGVLHAQGHDHQTDRQAQRMERLEARLLAELGYRDPYLPVADPTPAPRTPRRKAASLAGA